ncbi:MAG: hypothetical protein WDN45_07170 [Caulobacteraceae bacterium]
MRRDLCLTSIFDKDTHHARRWRKAPGLQDRRREAGFNNHEEKGVSAFEPVTGASFPGKWKVIFFYPRTSPSSVRPRSSPSPS